VAVLLRGHVQHRLAAAALPGWARDVLSVNPAAVYISLTRYAIMATIRTDAPGAKPYNAAQCALFTTKKTPALQA
jgi:hypothetical protein